MDRIKTNIPGLDALIQGGIPENDLIILSGTCGTGKTVFSLEYLYFSKEPSIYVTFEDQPSELRSQALGFGWDLKKLEDRGILKILKYDPFKIEDVFGMIENNIREIKAKYVVIDSVSAFAIYMRDETEVRRTLLQVYDILKKNKCTSILISEIQPGTHKISRFGVEEFVCDGVIVLRKILQDNEYKRAINVWKMKGTNHSRKFHMYEINNKGFFVYPNKVIDFRNVHFFT